MPQARSPLVRLARSLSARVTNLAMKVPHVRNAYFPLWRTHPFDREFGIETSGMLSTDKIHHDRQLSGLISPYIGSQPSIVRKALCALGTYDDYAFVDFGCGKGRAVVVATEFPFRSVTGVELSTSLAATAQANATKMAAQFPSRPAANIVAANVCDFPLPPGKVVCFNYHAFGPEILAQVIAKFETALAGDTPQMFVIYYNPIQFGLFDASPAFRRFYAERIPYDESEIGFGPDRDDVVVIWQSVRGATLAQHQGADRKILVTEDEKVQFAD